jgi:hypothetical protein
MAQQARNFSLLVAENAVQPSYLIHDRDGAFLPLDEVLRPAGRSKVSLLGAVETPNPGIGLAGCQCRHPKEDGRAVYAIGMKDQVGFRQLNVR